MMITMLFALAAAGQELDPDCLAAVTPAEIAACSGENFVRADAALNAQWTLTVAGVQARDGKRGHKDDDRAGHYDTLLSAQRAWLTYRDQHCVSEGYAARGESSAPGLVLICKTKLTRQRTEQLKALVEEPGVK